MTTAEKHVDRKRPERVQEQNENERAGERRREKRWKRETGGKRENKH